MACVWLQVYLEISEVNSKFDPRMFWQSDPPWRLSPEVRQLSGKGGLIIVRGRRAAEEREEFSKHDKGEGGS